MSALRAALLAAVAASAASAAALADEAGKAARSHTRVDYDQATVVRLDRSAKTVLVGNPLIADALLVNDKTIYIQGRLFGNTNVIAIDADGAEILNTQVTVSTPMVAQVTIYRGTEGQRNLACMPYCERTMTQGDREHDIVFNHNDRKLDNSRKSAELSNGK
jgi:hypothetical protein